MALFSTAFEERIARLRQDPQQVAREAARAGERVVGYVGNDIPIALIIAAAALPVRTVGRQAPRRGPTASSRARSRPSCVSSWRSG